MKISNLWQKVSLEEGRALSRAGEWIPNPRFGLIDREGNREPARIFQAHFLCHARPDPLLPEEKQYYLVQGIV